MDLLTIILIAANVLISYKGFSDPGFFERNLFEVGRVLRNKEYGRLFMSGFLHVDWTHLLFNMFSLYSFSISLERYLGPVQVAVIYFASLFGGDLLAIFIHRNHPNYRAVGASGAVSGIIFAAIAIFPGIQVSIFLIPIGIPGWLFGACYVLYSMYGIRSSVGNIGHEAHLGGALVGLLTAIALVPAVLTENTLPVVLIGVLCLVFLFLITLRPDALKLGGVARRRKQPTLTQDDRYNTRKVEEQRELDAILDKVRKYGADSLTPQERQKLDSWSDKR